MITANPRILGLFAVCAFTAAFILAVAAGAQESKTLRVEAKEAESLMQEAVAISMYLAETLEAMDQKRDRADLGPAVQKALSRRLHTGD